MPISTTCRSRTDAMRGDLGRNDALVDSDDAVYEGLDDAPDTADVAAVEMAARPNSVSLAISIASASVRKWWSGAMTAPGSNPSATFMAPAVSARRLVKAS
jgi:hypothetical protein